MMGIAQPADATEALYRAFAPELRRYLRRLCRNGELAEDLLQETFQRAHAALPRLQPDAPRRPWLYAIATNLARSAGRAAYWRHVRPLSEVDLERTHDGALDGSAATADLIERSLAALKPDDAALVLLHWRAGFGIDELCQALGVRRDALKKRLYRAKKAFSAAYARECAHAEEGRTA
jgi:RNA polymerase sigma-70 factor (ECF subfamily)